MLPWCKMNDDELDAVVGGALPETEAPKKTGPVPPGSSAIVLFDEADPEQMTDMP